MQGTCVIILFGLLLCASVKADETSQNETQILEEGEKRMSEQILKILDHFKQDDPVGIPGADIPDPYKVPDMTQVLSVATINFKDMAVYGISKFRIIYIDAEIADMEVNAAMTIDSLQVLGNYTMFTWLSKSQGPFTVDLKDLSIKARATLGVERDGRLQAQDIDIDIGFKTIAMNFENLGFFGAMFQSIVNSVGNYLFDSIKPFILKEAYTKMRAEINAKLDEFAGDMQFPNSISPLDMVIVDARKKVRAMKMDPYQINDWNKTMNMVQVKLVNTSVTGISSFYRVGNISLRMENNKVVADVEIGTQKLLGSTQWEISAIGGILSRTGTALFSVEYISVRIILGQPLDTRKRLELKDLDLEVGNIQVRCNGAGTLDYLVEVIVNILPNLLRYQIIDTLEGPIQERLQQYLNKINVEETIKSKLPEIDAMQEKGFKLSEFKTPEVEAERYDVDDFFNF